MDELKPFKRLTECPKCRARDIHGTGYMEESSCECGRIFSPFTMYGSACPAQPRIFLFFKDSCVFTIKREYFRRQCNCCGFSWKEAVITA